MLWWMQPADQQGKLLGMGRWAIRRPERPRYWSQSESIPIENFTSNWSSICVLAHNLRFLHSVTFEQSFADSQSERGFGKCWKGRGKCVDPLAIDCSLRTLSITKQHNHCWLGFNYDVLACHVSSVKAKLLHPFDSDVLLNVPHKNTTCCLWAGGTLFFLQPFL